MTICRGRHAKPSTTCSERTRSSVRQRTKPKPREETRGKQETMDNMYGDEASPKIWKTSRTCLRGRPKNGQNIGWGKNSRLWASSSAKKVLLTAEKVEIGPKLAKIQHGVKLDIFKITRIWHWIRGVFCHHFCVARLLPASSGGRGLNSVSDSSGGSCTTPSASGTLSRPDLGRAPSSEESMRVRLWWITPGSPDSEVLQLVHFANNILPSCVCL